MAEIAQVTLAADYDRIQLDRSTLRLYMPNAATAVPVVINQLNRSDLKASSLTITQPTLDDVFLKVTGLRFEAEAVKAAATQV